MKKVLILTGLFALVALSSLFADTLLFNQPRETIDEGFQTSTYNPLTPVDYEVADNFSGLAQTINKITFYGIAATYNSGFNPAVPAATEPFFVKFYTYVPAAEPNWVAPVASFNVTATTSYVTDISWYAGWGIYKYELTLPAPVDMAEGWLSVQIDATTGSGSWFVWSHATGGDLISHQRSGAKSGSEMAGLYPPSDVSRVLVTEDMAFELYAADPPTGYTYEVNAFCLDWYTGNGYEFPTNQPPFNDPNDVHAEILLNGVSFVPPIYTPYWFGALGNEPFIAGTYSVSMPVCVDWLPTDVTFLFITTDYETDFLGEPVCTCPVELSSFTAMLTAQNYVQLSWVSQTESNMMGYRVYRNETDNEATATMITPVLIPATNTSSQQSYSVIDNEVEIGTTYYYWLEGVDMSSSEFFGPLSIVVEGEAPPVIPEASSMKNAYPNPFKATSNTNIEVALKAGENGTVTIYNLLGQVVRSFSVVEGTHTITWNGMDSKGSACSSGVYFYKLSTPSLNQTSKMVILK